MREREGRCSSYVDKVEEKVGGDTTCHDVLNDHEKEEEETDSKLL